MYRRSRGVELGTFGPRVLSSAFQEQSIYWQKMATQYLSKVILSVHKFILGALGKVCYETRILDELISGLMADLLARYQDGMNRAIHLVHIERHKKPYTLNHYFNENLQKARNDRINKTLKKKRRGMIKILRSKLLSLMISCEEIFVRFIASKL